MGHYAGRCTEVSQKQQHINLYTQLTQEARYLQDTSYYEYEIQLVYATKWLGKNECLRFIHCNEETVATVVYTLKG